MDRRKKVLNHLNLSGHGVEIGPSHNPIAPKKKGYDVHIIDHMNQDDLRRKYEDHPVNIDNIEPVDYVWHGGSYAELIGKNKYYDWIIASHLIEHTPDLIGFLNDCDAILKDEGMISLVIPDKRFCFDHHRPITGISKVIDSHLQKSTIHTPGTVAEYFLNVVSKNGNIAWGRTTFGKYRFVHSLEIALQEMDKVMAENIYLDVHAWCFVPSSFRLLVHDLFHLGFIPFQEVCFFPTQGCEFFVTLGRKGKGIDLPRMDMLERIEKEMREA